jgi:hypothetical protein
MLHAETVSQILYVSQLAPTRKFSCVSEIIATSRVANSARGLTGALIFDGEYFCQLIEGDDAEVQDLMQRIADDPRHTNVTLLFASQTSHARLTRSWRSGYCEAQLLGAFAQAEGPRGDTALAAFMSVLASADME